MTDLDLDRIDAAFAAVAGPQVSPPGPEAVATTYRHRRRVRAVAALAALPLPGGLGRYYELGNMVADPLGRIVVGVYDWNGPTGPGYPDPNAAKVVMWDHGRSTILPIPSPLDGITGVNPGGTVIGSGFDNGPGWEYRDGKFTRLPSVGRWISTPDAIDAAGNIVGSFFDNYYSANSVLWPADHPGTVARLGSTPVDATTNVYYRDTDGTLRTVKPRPGDIAGGVDTIEPDWVIGAVRPGSDPYYDLGAIWNKASGAITVIPWKNITITAVNPAGSRSAGSSGPR